VKAVFHSACRSGLILSSYIAGPAPADANGIAAFTPAVTE